MPIGLLLPLMLCIAAVVWLAVILLAITLLSPNHTVVKFLHGRLSTITLRGWTKWMIPLVLAFILAIWTIWGALFFLIVVWLMRQNPVSGSSSSIGQNEKKTAQRVYTWLFFSPFLTVPILIAAILSAYDASTNVRVLAALTPLIVHSVLLSGLTSKNVFVFRHTQQGILLIAVRAAMASLAVSVGDYPEDGLLLFLFGNGALWLFGSIWGLNQISRGDCWWMRRQGEMIKMAASKVGKLAPYVHLEKSREFLQGSKKTEAKDHALAAFRTGNSEIRAQAVWLLEVLEEVEKF